MKQGSFPGAGLCCPAPSSGTTTPSDCLSATRHFPALAGYRRELLPGPRRFGAEEALSSSHDTPLTIPRPLRRRVPWHPLQALWCRPWPSPAEWRLGSLLAAVAVFLTTPQASLDAADWSVAPRPASTPGSRPTPGAALPGTLASPRTGLPPAGCRELVARLRRGALLSVVLGARAGWTHIPPESRRDIAASAHGRQRPLPSLRQPRLLSGAAASGAVAASRLGDNEERMGGG